MKLRKLALNAIALEHSEMKSIKAGYYGGYSCYAFPDAGSQDYVQCSTEFGNSCMDANGRLGQCGLTQILALKPDASTCGCIV